MDKFLTKVRGMTNPNETGSVSPDLPTTTTITTAQSSPASPSQQQTTSSQQQQQQNEGVRTINLKTATREEMVDFIKQYSQHTRQLESRSKELYDQCKSLRQERITIKEATQLQITRLENEVQRLAAACLDAVSDVESGIPERSIAAIVKLKSASSSASIQIQTQTQLFLPQQQPSSNSQQPSSSAEIKNKISMISSVIAKLKETNEINRKLVVETKTFAQSIPTIPTNLTTATNGTIPVEIEVFRLREEVISLRKSRDNLQNQLQRVSTELGQNIEHLNTIESEKRTLQDSLTSQQELVSQLQNQISATSNQTNSNQNNQNSQNSEEEISKLKEKIAKLQQLLAKTKEQFDAKSHSAAERAAEVARLRSELAKSVGIIDDLKVHLVAEEDSKESAQEALRIIRREFSQRIESLESRLRESEAQLSSNQEEFKNYRVRAQLAMKEQQLQLQQKTEENRSSMTVEEERRLKEEMELSSNKVKELQREKEICMAELCKVKENGAKLESQAIEMRHEFELKQSRAISAIEAEYGLKYDEIREALREHREKSKKLIDERDSQLAILQTQLSESRQQLVAFKSSPATPTPIIPTTPTILQQSSSTPPRMKNQQQQQQQQIETPVGLLHFENVKAVNETELNELRKHCRELENEISELEHTVQLHELQEKTLKEQIRDCDRSKSRVEVNAEYLKNVVVNYMERSMTEHDRLLPVIAKLLSLSPEEISHINEIRRKSIPK